MKKFIYFGIGFLICIIITIIFFRTGHNNKIYISIANPGNFIEINNNKWNYSESDYSAVFKQSKFDVYSGNKYLGKYNIKYTDHWYIYDDDYHSIDYDEQLLVTSVGAIQLSDFDKIEFDNDDINSIKHTLDQEKIVYNDDINGYKIYFDIDDDGHNEILYNVYSIHDGITDLEENYEESNEDSYLYNLIYIVKNDTKYFLEKEIFENQEYYYSMLFHDIDYILKTKNSNKYKIVIYETRFSATNERSYSVYEFNDNKIKTLLKANLDYQESYGDTSTTNIFSGIITFTYFVIGIFVFLFIILFLKQKASNKI